MPAKLSLGKPRSGGASSATNYLVVASLLLVSRRSDPRSSDPSLLVRGSASPPLITASLLATRFSPRTRTRLSSLRSSRLVLVRGSNLVARSSGRRQSSSASKLATLDWGFYAPANLQKQKRETRQLFRANYENNKQF